MRTKTLILTAVLGVVGAATASAQVYSVNTVGYVNVTLCPGFNIIGNPLDNKTGNSVANLFGTALTSGSTVYKFTNGAYEPSNTYDTDLGGWDNAAQTLVPGEGFWLYLDGAVQKTVTFVGDVKQGTLTIPLNKGFNLVASMVPQAGKLQADLGYLPVSGDTVYQFNCGGPYKASVLFDPDLGGWDPGDPWIDVAQGFWVYKEAAGEWKREFTVK